MGCSPYIFGCTISGNTSSSFGGGLRTAYGDASLADNDFCANIPDDIGGVWVDLDGNQFTESCPVYEGACCTNGGCVLVLVVAHAVSHHVWRDDTMAEQK